jgi:hypothetical protein
MANSKAGWFLVLAGLVLLVGKLDLLVILIPAAALLAYSFAWLGRGHRA